MLERPSTSGGPRSKNSTTNFNNFDRRMSRDDSFVNLRAGKPAGFNPYPPRRGQLPTHDTSSRSSPASQTPYGPTVSMPTSESVSDGGPMHIGMALGSPSRPPIDWASSNSNSQSTLRPPESSTPPVVISPASGDGSPDSFDTSAPKKQPGKWKLFGRFGRKHSSSTPAEPSELKGSNRPGQSSATSFPSHVEGKSPERSNTVDSRKAPKYKPIVIRSQTMPYTENPGQVSQASSRQRQGRDKSGSIPTRLDVPGSNKPSPMLNVDIPDITLERYSVMFGSVLQPQKQPESKSESESQGQAQPQEQLQLKRGPSLLARRQATARKLKCIEDAIEKEEEAKHRGGVPIPIPRRITSPQSTVKSPTTKSPAFALFPPTPSAKQPSLPAPSRVPTLSRSNTSPALLPSPSRATFDHPSPNSSPSIDEHPPPAVNHLKHPSLDHTPKGKLTIATLARARDQQPAPRTFQFNPEQSSLILDSPTDLESPEFEAVRTVSLRPSAQHMQPSPTWQMINPSQGTLSTASSVTSEKRRSPSSASSANTHVTHPSSASSAHTHITHPSQDLDEPSRPQQAGKMDAVEISIARQISISREQRKMLRPLQTSPPPSKPQRSPGKTSPMAKIPMGKNERLVETRTLTPTLVHPPETAHQQQTQFRKSEHVVLERVEPTYVSNYYDERSP